MEKAVAKEIDIRASGGAVSIQDVNKEVSTNRPCQADPKCYLAGQHRKQIEKRKGA